MTSFALVVVKCMDQEFSIAVHLKTIIFSLPWHFVLSGFHCYCCFLLPGSDEEMDKLAEEEEEEALALQKHMAACLEEQDFDTAEFEVRLSWLYTCTSHRR